MPVKVQWSQLLVTQGSVTEQPCFLDSKLPFGERKIELFFLGDLSHFVTWHEHVPKGHKGNNCFHYLDEGIFVIRGIDDLW